MADFQSQIENALSNLSPQSQQQLAEFVEEKQQELEFQSETNSMTEKCFDVCIQKPGTSLSSGEEACLKNCVERFIDTSFQIVRKIAADQGRQ
jgi:import inner membrane translocase subunit TIM8